MPEGGSFAGGTYFGIDYGRKGIGIAVGQRISQTARPLATLTPQGFDHQLAQLIGEWQPAALVVGLPLPLEASAPENPLIEEIRAFGDRLQQQFGLEVHWVDEALSTRACETLFYEQPRRKSTDFRKVKDQMAAALILETWFSLDRPGGSFHA